MTLPDIPVDGAAEALAGTLRWYGWRVASENGRIAIAPRSLTDLYGAAARCIAIVSAVAGLLLLPAFVGPGLVLLVFALGLSIARIASGRAVQNG